MNYIYSLFYFFVFYAQKNPKNQKKNYMNFSLLLLLFLSLVLLSSCEDPSPPSKLNVRVWRGVEKLGEKFQYPELELSDVQSKANVAFLFSGGGTRAFTITMAYLRVLLDLGLLDKVRYISGISGGSFASTLFSFYDASVPGVAGNDRELLGEIIPPQNLSLSSLGLMCQRCARKVAVVDMYGNIVQGILAGVSPSDIWTYCMTEQFLEPFGIDRDSLFSYNNETLADLLRRNPGLNPDDFLLQHPNRPFLVVGTTVLGPEEIAPLSTKKRAFTKMSMTPLYVGESWNMNVTYFGSILDNETASKEDDDKRKGYSRMVGGFIENIGFGGLAPDIGISPQNETEIIEIDQPKRMFTLGDMISASSFAPGAIFSQLPIVQGQVKVSHEYWAPSQSSPHSEPFLFGDGGDMENEQGFGMIKRGVRNLFFFWNCDTPLKPRSDYDPYKRPPKSDDLGDDLPGYFGIFPDTPATYDLTRNQMFNQSDFPMLVDKMQQAQSLGKGIVVRTQLRTVENTWYGIEGGIELNVTWIYLSRAFEWEKLLPDEVKKIAVPDKNAEDPSSLVKKGIVKNFPHYETVAQFVQNPVMVNLLSHLSGWMLQQNAHTILEAFNAAE